MRVNEITTVRNRLDEAPMGMLAKAGRTVAAKLGHSASRGQLKTGEKANKLKKEYEIFLGELGEKASAENLLNFLKQQGFPTSDAQQVISNAGPSVAQQLGGVLKTAAKGAAGAVTGAVTGAAKGAVQGAKAATQKPPAAESLNEETLSSATIDQAIIAAVKQVVRDQSTTATQGSGTPASQARSAAGTPQHKTAQPATSTAAGTDASTTTAAVSGPDLLQKVSQLDDAQKQQLTGLLKLEPGMLQLASQITQAGAETVSQALNAMATPTATPTAIPTATPTAAQPDQQTRQAALDRTAQRRARNQQAAGQPATKPRVRPTPATAAPAR
jgi:hypothetical protein